MGLLYRIIRWIEKRQAINVFKKIKDNIDLWFVVSALRGPDMPLHHVKLCYTGIIRAIVEVTASKGKYTVKDLEWDLQKCYDFLIEQELLKYIRDNEPVYVITSLIHYLTHISDAVYSLHELGIIDDIIEENICKLLEPIMDPIRDIDPVIIPTREELLEQYRGVGKKIRQVIESIRGEQLEGKD